MADRLYVEAPAARVELRFVFPLVLAVLRIEGAKLERLQPQCEARAELLQPRRDLSPLLLLLKDVPVVAEEDEIALVVHRHNLPAAKLRIVRKQARQHPSEPVPEAGAKAVEDELRPVSSRTAMPSDALGQDERRDLEARRRPVRQLDQPERLRLLLLVFGEDEERGEAALVARVDKLLERHRAALAVLAVRKQRHHLLHEAEQLVGRISPGGHQSARRHVAREVGGELVKGVFRGDLLVTRLDHRVVRLARVVQRALHVRRRRLA
mmetsp:Transcript_48526/g.157282  ORF Transcript_48526/g.157282 Transcript_48526/m.157282 type:complete len:266 (+) Transcript_48526:80-877(+)